MVIALLPIYAVDILETDADGLCPAGDAQLAPSVGLLLARMSPMRNVGRKLFLVRQYSP